MSLQDLLNSDLSTLWAAVRQGFAWWMEELSQLLPERFRDGRRATELVAEVDPARGSVRLWRDGVPAGPVGPGKRADIALPSSAVLVRELDLPLLGRGDLRRLMAIDLERLTPLPAELVWWDTEVVHRDLEAGRQTVRLAVATRTACETALGAVRAAGLQPARLGRLEPQGGLSFDFSRSAASGGDALDQRKLYWGGAVAALVALNLLAFILRDVGDVDYLRDVVASQQAPAALARRLEQSVAREADRRRLLVHRQADTEPLRILDAATLALPAGEWVQHLEWNGHTLRLVGFRPPASSVEAALRASPAIAAAHALSTEAAAPHASVAPFDVVAEARPAPR